jgi:polysaccharide biosynthesis protein PslH
VDLEFFHPVEKQDSGAICTYPKLVFVGVLDYKPNVDGLLWFCESVFPALRQRFPQTTLQIVGKRPQVRVQRLTEITGIQLASDVPDVRPYLQHADMAIAPLQIARGVQNKVLEALASGLPVIASSFAAKGIETDGGIEIADTLPQWLDAIHKLSSPEIYKEACLSARENMERSYSWATQLTPLLSALNMDSNH